MKAADLKPLIAVNPKTIQAIAFTKKATIIHYHPHITSSYYLSLPPVKAMPELLVPADEIEEFKVIVQKAEDDAQVKVRRVTRAKSPKSWLLSVGEEELTFKYPAEEEAAVVSEQQVKAVASFTLDREEFIQAVKTVKPFLATKSSDVGRTGLTCIGVRAVQKKLGKGRPKGLHFVGTNGRILVIQNVRKFSHKGTIADNSKERFFLISPDLYPHLKMLSKLSAEKVQLLFDKRDRCRVKCGKIYYLSDVVPHSLPNIDGAIPKRLPLVEGRLETCSNGELKAFKKELKEKGGKSPQYDYYLLWFLLTEAGIRLENRWKVPNPKHFTLRMRHRLAPPFDFSVINGHGYPISLRCDWKMLEPILSQPELDIFLRSRSVRGRHPKKHGDMMYKIPYHKVRGKKYREVNEPVEFISPDKNFYALLMPVAEKHHL